MLVTIIDCLAERHNLLPTFSSRRVYNGWQRDMGEIIFGTILTVFFFKVSSVLLQHRHHVGHSSTKYRSEHVTISANRLSLQWRAIHTAEHKRWLRRFF